jgi:hypothetical protein
MVNHQCNDNGGHIFPRIYFYSSDTVGKFAAGINIAGGKSSTVVTETPVVHLEV